MEIKLDDLCLNKYKPDIIQKQIIKKNVWIYKGSRSLYIIMEKILPLEIINYIEEYIADIHIYYLPINPQNDLFEHKDNYFYGPTHQHTHKISVVLDSPKKSVVCCVYNNHLSEKDILQSISSQ